MNPETKKKLIGAFLKRMFSRNYQDFWLEHIDDYDYLGQAIEYLHTNGPDFLDLDCLDNNKAEFGVFCNILCTAITFSKTIPPVSTELNLENLNARCLAEARIWTSCADANYSSRKTVFLPASHDNELNELKKDAIQVLIATTLKSCLPSLKLLTLSDLSNAIDSYAGLSAKETDMSDDKMELDTRLGLMPVGAGKYLRHNQGRNKSVIEDSSFVSKLESIVSLLANRDHISMMIKHIILVHQAKRRAAHAEIDQLNSMTTIRSFEEAMHLEKLQEQHDVFDILENDAILIGEILSARMKSIFKHFPSVNNQVMDAAVFLANKNLIKQCLIFEKMLNKPVLFADDGRPYKHPWTTQNTTLIKTIKVKGELVLLGFDAFEIEQLIQVLRVCGIHPDTCRVSMGHISIPLSELNKINETTMFPEYGGFNSRTDYLDICHLAYSKDVYSEDMQAKALLIIKQYQRQLAQTQTPKDKILAMDFALQAIQKMYFKEGSKGFYKHLELKLQFDVYQQLLKLIPILCPDLPVMTAQMLQALEAAIKLDRVNDLTQVLFAFARNPLQQNKVVLINYLGNCIENAVLATDYNQAKIQSKELKKQSFEICQHISRAESNSPAMMMQKMAGRSAVLPQNRDDVAETDEMPVIKKKEVTERATEQQQVMNLFW